MRIIDLTGFGSSSSENSSFLEEDLGVQDSVMGLTVSRAGVMTLEPKGRIEELELSQDLSGGTIVDVTNVPFWMEDLSPYNRQPLVNGKTKFFVNSYQVEATVISPTSFKLSRDVGAGSTIHTEEV